METNNKALQAKIAFQEIVNKTSPQNDEGKREYYTSPLKKNEYTNKKGEQISEQVFSLRNHQNEEVQFALSHNGILKNATYILWEDKKPHKTFLAKDLSKLSEVAKDKGLVEMAAKFDWSKAPAKEQSGGEFRSIREELTEELEDANRGLENDKDIDLD